MTDTISESTIKLANLVAKVDAFVNGGVETVVNTTSGPLKSLAATVAEIETIQYVAQCRDYNTLSDLLAGQGDILVGQVARVNIDPTTENNGFYQMQELNGLVKIQYSDLYDLNDLLPNPFNDLDIKFDETQTAVELPLVQARIPVSANFIQGSTFSARVEYTSDVDGDAFYFTQAYDVRVAARASGEYDKSSNTVGTSSLQLADRNPTQLPLLRVDHGVEGSVHIFTVVLVAPVQGTTKLPGHGRVLVKDIDLKVFQKLV